MKIIFIIFCGAMFLNPQPTPKYTWMGKEVTYKQFRDSLRVNYLNFCDSLKRERLKENKK